MPRAPPVITTTRPSSCINAPPSSPAPHPSDQQALSLELQPPTFLPDPEAAPIVLETGLHHRPGPPLRRGAREGPRDPLREVDHERDRLLAAVRQAGRSERRAHLVTGQRPGVRRVAQPLDRLVVLPARRIVGRPHVL